MTLVTMITIMIEITKITWNVKWHEMSNDMKCQMTWNVKWHEMSNDAKWQMTRNVKWHEMSNDMKWHMTHDVIYHEMLMLDLWLQAETPGVTHFGAYIRPPDGHFLGSGIEFLGKVRGVHHQLCNAKCNTHALCWEFYNNVSRPFFCKQQTDIPN